MPFPEAPRVIYKKNPLDRVICQLRFPPILKIEAEAPAEFQERIRKEFPEFREKEESSLSVPQRVQQELPIEVLRQIIPSATKNYEFSSEDGVWHVNLTRTFIALTTRKYRRRDEFQKKLAGPLAALRELYEPAYFSRIGLRYVDITKRSELNLDDVSWTDLLKPYVLGLLSSGEVSKNIQSMEAKSEIRLSEQTGIARIKTGLVQWEEKNEECFLIDTDFFTTDKTEIKDVTNKLDFFHVRASRLIRWLIKDHLHQAMEPQEL